jgi:hypothetical protein
LVLCFHKGAQEGWNQEGDTHSTHAGEWIGSTHWVILWNRKKWRVIFLPGHWMPLISLKLTGYRSWATTWPFKCGGSTSGLINSGALLELRTRHHGTGGTSTSTVLAPSTS